MKNDVTLLDTKAGNLYSLKAALEKIDRRVTIAQTPDQVVGEQIVIPGQGHFGSVMKNIRAAGWPEFLNDWRHQNQSLVGICVGMQIFFEGSEEAPGEQGLGWFTGQAARLNFPKKPMVGWAPLSVSDASSDMPEGVAYFVNSFAIRESSSCIATTNYGETFCAAIKSSKTVGFQFHPEKSSQYGLELLSYALNLEA